MVPVSDSQVDLTNNFFVVPKSGGRWCLIIDLNHYLSPSHFKMERLYMLPNAVHLDFFMAKVDLKDAYLTIPSVGKVSLYLGLSKQRQDSFCNSRPFHLDSATFHILVQRHQSW